ncbi:centrosomal protein of 162 kDa isoform X1 [Chiloscyllium plagiosum]|uniref:centrosomal protein of 162 kDa isoform X1 n=1 Tax=Chiloscyllium plagiosum TaxID=36176 RepID=UPI001CB85803|nr:centrosomal protein of 162 kDa isoform X1 [Chiloscyllium plagiosum]XP_043542918.1 centrosomal protein of 162 kDa isoform X1 [Chiloscyllium plagiosum]XP_043542919.1 centrosomal protein of 162 kDa isoform X1 [Chiloscyllium plagiosum]XP_043542920.1 centrosomal protein of 162 kDa isoform X1 [Chiloscyllium plagiosum]
MSHKLSKEEIEEQFEQFLKESVSDESVDLENSPKSNVLGSLGKHTRKEIKKDANPWWINDNDSDEEQPPLRRFSKLKRQPAVIDAGVKAMVKEIGDVCVGNALCQSPVSQEDVLGVNRSFLKSQRFSQSIAEIEEEQNQKERERTSVSISQDSLEPNDSTMASGPRQSTPGVGLDTLEEEEEKEKFFANLEKGASSTIDYSKLNKELESTDSIPLATLNQNENRLQVLEIEGTKEEDESRPKSITASKCYSDDFDDYSDAKFGSEDFGLDDNILKTECIPETVETVKETKEQETEPGMLAKVVLLDSLDSTPDTQKLLQSEDDRSMIKPTTEEKYGQQDQASQMYTTNISYGQTNSDIEALHQAYCDIDQSLEATDAVQSIKNGNIINSVQDLQSPVKDSTRNISTGESDLFTIEELMKPIKAGVLVPRGYDSHPVSKNAQQHCEATETFRRTMAKDTYSAVPSELQLDSNHLSGRQSTYIELSEKLLKENESCMSRICEEDMEALLDEVKYDPTVKHSVSASQNVPHQDDQISSKTKSPKVKNKPIDGNYAFVKSSGYGKVSSSKKESFGVSEKKTYQSPPKQTAPIKGFKARSPAEHAKGKSKGQLHATQTLRPAKHKFNENDLGSPLLTSVQSFTLSHQTNSKTDHAKLIGVHMQNQLLTRADEEISIDQRQCSIEPSNTARELALLQKLEEAHEKWNIEHNLMEKLKENLAVKEKELIDKDEELKKVPQLNKEILILQTKLHSLEANRKKLIFGGPLDPVTEEKLKLIEKEVQEQETLIQGYHQENERLYSQVKELQVLKKRNEEKMFTETQHLMAEIHRLKKHSHKDNMKQVSVHDVQLTEQVKDQNITDLLSQLRVKQKEETKYIEEIKKLKQEKQALMVDVEKMSKECNVAKMQLTYTSGDKEFEMKIMEEQYKQEIQRLNKRLQWYAENQEMLDKDASRLKAANLEIEKLKEQVEKLTAYSRDKNSPPEKRAKARALEAKRIQDLERQIKEMEEIIRRRYPNSLPALIYAAASVPEADSETEGRLHSRAFLEKRIKKLEADLEGKDEEAKKSLRVMEQQFQKIKIQYEQRVSDLEQCLVDKLIHERENLDDSDPKMKILEEEIFKLKEAHKSKENRLRSDIEKLKNQLYQTELKLMEREESSLRMADQHKQHSYQHAKIEKLNLELATKNREIQELSKTLEHLQRERRVLLNNKSQAEKYTQQKLIKKSKKDNECTESFPATLDEKIYQPNDFSGSHISEVLKENDILKSNIERLSLEVEQQRAQLAQFENEARRAQGDIAEHVAALKAAHQQELEQILTQHALEHSSSKVAELTNKISAQEVMMKHLREQINELQKDREALSFTKLREDALQSQMAKLLEELREAKENHSPEMKHFLALERKIQKMEFKYAQREQEFQQLIQQARHSADAEQIQEVEKWKKLAQFKNHELENFRTELDSILDVLRELQRQGVVIPAPSSTRQTISTFTRQL